MGAIGWILVLAVVAFLVVMVVRGRGR